MAEALSTCFLTERGVVGGRHHERRERRRRKVGHLNVQATDREQLKKRLSELEAALYPEGEPL